MTDKKKIIYADDLQKSIVDDVTIKGSAFAAIMRHLQDAPAVDAVEVVHGRWVLQRYYGGIRKGMVARVICSECGYPNEKTNYCPNCGAKMDGGNEDGNG